MWGKAIVPAIRFTGFTDAWEQRKISDTAPLQRGFDLPSADMKPGDYPVVMSNGIGGYHSECKAKGPGVVTGRSGTIGKLHYIEGNYWPHNTSLWVTSFKGNSPKFIYYLYQKLNLGRFGSGSGVPTLNRNDVHDAVVMIPSFKEQERLAEYLTHLDHLITLHQRKYSRLCNIKKSMLERMFPKEGASVPEIRFAGFTDAWEQRKLGEIVREVTRNDPTSSAPIMMITANNGFIEQSERYAFNNAGESLKKYILLEKGELAYNHGASKLRPYGSCFPLATAENARIPFVYHCFSAEGQNPEFMSIELNGADIENQLRQIVSSGARMDGLLNISFEEYTSISVLLPSIAEQNRIADFFCHLDHLITLHQRKLERLQNIKKSCLEKMFV